MHINITPAEITGLHLNSVSTRDTFVIIQLSNVGYLTLKKQEVERLRKELGDILANWP